jgi:hypothetical protein
MSARIVFTILFVAILFALLGFFMPVIMAGIDAG